MGSFDIDVTEVTDYARVLGRMADDGALAFTGIAAKYRDRTMAEARRTVRVKTGQLRGSIQPAPSEASRMGYNADWSVTAPHASPIERGFKHWRSGRFIGPFPYVRPALSRFRGPYLSELITAAKAKGITKTASRGALRGVNRLR